MTQLIKYEAACRALSECKSFDEVTQIVNQAEAMRAYGRMAQDKSLQLDAADIRLRAERRLGQMLVQQKADGGLNRGAAGIGPIAVVDPDRIQVPTLADAGISKDLSSRSQKLAAVSDAEFESELAAKREREQQDGARVTAKLIQSGEAALAKAQAQAPENFGPSIEEIAEAERAAADDAEAVRILLEADAPLAEMTVRCKQQVAQIRILESRIVGLQGECSEARSLAKSWRSKYEKLQKVNA